MVSGGYGCGTEGANYTGTTGTYTYLDTSNTIDSNGSLKSWCFRSSGAISQIKLKIFRLNGSNYDVVWAGDAESISTTAGVYTFALNSAVPVLSGDYVGFTITGTSASISHDTGSGIYQKAADVINTTTTASWTNLSAGNLRVNVSSDSVTTLYVKTTGDDTYSGSYWGSAKKNIKDGLRFIPSAGTLRIGFGDYSAQPGIKFDKSVSLLCETATTGGGTGTVNLPTAAWSQCSSTIVLDRSNTNYNGADMDVNGCGSYSIHPNKIGIHNAFAQRFVPSSRCLKKITLKLQRLYETVDLYVEIRNDSSGVPQGNPQEATGQVDYIVITATDITTLSPTDYDITLDADMTDTNPKWIVISLSTYDPATTDNTEYYFVGWDAYGTNNEQIAMRIGNCFGDTWATSVNRPNMYFKTWRNI